MEAAWAPRLRKLLRSCCGSAAIMGHNTALSDTPAGATGRRPALHRCQMSPSDSAKGLLGGHVQAWGWLVCWFCFYRLSF